MTPEEYLDKKKSGRFIGGELYYTVSLDDAMKAVEMARSENKPADNIPASAIYGWICPKCGRIYSPTVPTCMNCRNLEIGHVTCADQSERIK